MAVQWLGLLASNSGGTGLIPGQGTRIPHVRQHGQNNNKQMEVVHLGGEKGCWSKHYFCWL